MPKQYMPRRRFKKNPIPNLPPYFTSLEWHKFKEQIEKVSHLIYFVVENGDVNHVIVRQLKPSNNKLENGYSPQDEGTYKPIKAPSKINTEGDDPDDAIVGDPPPAEDPEIPEEGYHSLPGETTEEIDSFDPLPKKETPPPDENNMVALEVGMMIKVDHDGNVISGKVINIIEPDVIMVTSTGKKIVVNQEQILSASIPQKR